MGGCNSSIPVAESHIYRASDEDSTIPRLSPHESSSARTGSSAIGTAPGVLSTPSASATASKRVSVLGGNSVVLGVVAPEEDENPLMAASGSEKKRGAASSGLSIVASDGAGAIQPSPNGNNRDGPVRASNSTNRGKVVTNALGKAPISPKAINEDQTLSVNRLVSRKSSSNSQKKKDSTLPIPNNNIEQIQEEAMSLSPKKDLPEPRKPRSQAYIYPESPLNLAVAGYMEPKQ
eukprot:TRINITY_DN4983_c0_g1_i1.p1 TRINITY_DN4983_c0_g1~~TRINITY_DN4983_c0_g1_i1.p1  ORF type:complete len:234 (-),score=36.20 TRINITY_DN4983_c0_g1_i1:94-795(-)